MSKDLGGLEKSVRLPITAYDLLGYLAPGATALVSALLFEFWARNSVPSVSHLSTPVLTVVDVVGKGITGPDANFVYSFFILLVAAGSTYIVGHLVASISAFLIDRVLIQKGYGYPYGKLLGLGDCRLLPSAALFRAAFFWFNIYVLFRYVNVASSVLSSKMAIDVTLREIVFWAIRLSEWMMGLSLFGVLMYATLGKSLDCPAKDQRRFGRVCEIVSRLIAVPYDTCAASASNFLNTRRAFSPEFAERYQEQFNKLFGLSPLTEDTNNYWLSYLHVRNHSPRLTAMLDNWFGLYSFSRNVSTALFLVFLYTVIYLHVGAGLLVESSRNALTVLVLIPAAIWVLAVLMLVRFYYLYVSYYTKAVFRSFVYLCSLDVGQTDRKATKESRGPWAPCNRPPV